MAAPRRAALLIASYTYEDPGLRALTAPAHDADDLAAVLGDPQIAGFEVATLVNRTHHEVGAAVGEFLRALRRDDLALLYFTGHGLKDDDGRLHLAMSDTRVDNLLFTGLAADQLDRAMAACRSRRQVLVLDCCYSGAYPAGLVAKAGSDAHPLDGLQGRGRTVLTASSSIQYAFEGDRVSGAAPRSVFTRHLVAGLRDGSADLDGDGDITLDELYSYVHERVVADNPAQRPQKRDDVEGRTVIARNVHWVLPAYLRNALISPIAAERRTAIDGLDHLYRIGNDVVRDRVRAEYRRLVDDDSKIVSAAAAERLSDAYGVGAVDPLPAPRASNPVAEPPVATVTGQPASDPAPPLAAPIAGPPSQVAAADVAAGPGHTGGVKLPRDSDTAPPAPADSSTSPPSQAAAAETAAGPRTPGGVGQPRDLDPAPPPAAASPSATSPSQVPAAHVVGGPGRSGGVALPHDPDAPPPAAASPSATMPPSQATGADIAGPPHSAGVGLPPDSDPAPTPAAAVPSTTTPPQAAPARDLDPAPAEPATPATPAATADTSVADPNAGTRLAGVVRYVRGLGPRRAAVLGGVGVLLLVGVVLAVVLLRPGGYSGGDSASSGGVAGPAVTGVAVSADGTRLFVTHGTGSEVAVIDTATGTRARDPISVGAHPVDLLLGPEGRQLFVANYVDGTISFVDTATGTVTATAPTGPAPWHMAASADGRTLYVAGERDVSVIDVANRAAARAPIPVRAAGEAGGIALSPDGAHLYTLGQSGTTVNVIDTGSWTTVRQIELADFATTMAVSPDGARLFVLLTHSDAVAVVNTADGTVTTTVPVGDRPRWLVPAPDGERVYVANESGRSVTMIDATGPLDTIPLPDEPSGIAVAPDDSRLYVPTDFADVSVIDLEQRSTVGVPIDTTG